MCRTFGDLDVIPDPQQRAVGARIEQSDSPEAENSSERIFMDFVLCRMLCVRAGRRAAPRLGSHASGRLSIRVSAA
jgi:hypothetical protein